MQNSLEKFGYDVSELKSYSGYYKDNVKLKQSSSGGIATAIAEKFIAGGGVCFGVKYTDDFRKAEYCCIDKVSELEQLKGSKYIYADKKITIDSIKYSVYDILKEKLCNGYKVLYIGLGCDIAAVYKYCEFNKVDIRNLYTIDLICNGPTFQEVAKQFIDSIEKKYKSDIKEFTVRYKKCGWEPAYIRAVFHNGKIYEKPFNDSDYGLAFRNYCQEACFSCKFRGKNHKSDITIGDYWGIDKSSDEYNSDGVSIVFVNNPTKSDYLLKLINKDEFELSETDTIRALRGNPNYYRPRPYNSNYEKFKSDFNNKGLHYAARHVFSLKERFIMCIKKVIKRLVPHSIIAKVKNRVYN